MKFNLFEYIFFPLFTFFCFNKICAQEISVLDFYLDESDLTANRTAVLDQNGDKCSLIRVQTTQKGFLFDVGSAGITKVDDGHVGEIWLWVPYGIRHISIRHQQLGSLPNYDFPITIQKARTYIMKITHEQIFVNNYDDTKKQILKIKVNPSKAKLFLNGMSVELNSSGEATREMAYGQFTYKVEAEGYYPKEGQVIVDDNNKTLIIDDLKPIIGKLNIFTSPYIANIIVDGKTVNKSQLDPIELQIGKHEVQVSASGYKTEIRNVEIFENQTTDLSIKLSQIANYKFTSSPSEVKVFVDNASIGSTPCTKVLTTGTYTIKATKKGYKDYEKKLSLSSSEPNVHITLNKIFNYKNEFYIEGNIKVGSFVAFGGTLGAFINNINIEASYLVGASKSETIYWSGNDMKPVASFYKPTMNITGKIGYGFPISSRYRITPQIGASFVKIKESMQEGSNLTLADGSYASSGLISLRFSTAIINKLAISLTPELSFLFSKSKGYNSLSEVSPDIKKFGQGFNIKLGITTFF